MKASNSKSNKVSNRNIILKMIALNAPISRVELASRSGLSKMSLTNIINEFKEEGIVVETGIDNTAKGKRKPVLLELTDGAICSIGIHITRSYVEGCLADVKGNIMFTKREILPKTVNADILVSMVINIIQTIKDLENRIIVGIGISSMGPIDSKGGIILNPVNFYEITNLSIVDIVKKHFPDMPVFLCKNTNGAALAEKYYGTDKAIKNFAYLAVSKGVGCAAVVNDHLVTGANGFACEVGHISIDSDGELCSCGNRGCIEKYTSLTAAEQYAEEAISRGKDTVLKSPVTYHDIVSAAKKGDEVASEILDKQCKYLAAAVITLINVFDPSTIIVGNEIAVEGKEVIDRIRKFVGEVPISMKKHPVEIMLSKFYDKAPLLGSAVYVFETLLFNE